MDTVLMSGTEYVYSPVGDINRSVFIRAARVFKANYKRYIRDYRRWFDSTYFLIDKEEFAALRMVWAERKWQVLMRYVTAAPFHEMPPELYALIHGIEVRWHDVMPELMYVIVGGDYDFHYEHREAWKMYWELRREEETAVGTPIEHLAPLFREMLDKVTFDFLMSPKFMGLYFDECLKPELRDEVIRGRYGLYSFEKLKVVFRLFMSATGYYPTAVLEDRVRLLPPHHQ